MVGLTEARLNKPSSANWISIWHSSAKMCLNINKTNLSISNFPPHTLENHLVEIKKDLGVPAQKPISLNQGQLQGLLKKVSEQINKAKSSK